ncbi:M81 family metallopeptidase [Chloroflexota bacterium]
MKKARVLIAQFSHETNCLCPNKAGIKEYEERYLKYTEEIIPFFGGTKTEIGGFIEASKDERFEIIPAIAASATPTGLTTREIFELVMNRIIRTINNNSNIQGILLALHGAMVSENTFDSEGKLLKIIRDTVGPEIPIVATLDLHGNVTNEMVENANAFFPYKTYPHIDAFERGYEAAQCLVRMIRGEISPAMEMRQIPILAHTIETSSEPHLELLEEIHRWEEDNNVINVAVMHGFAWSDIPDAKMSVIAITNGHRKLAKDIVNDMAERIWGRRNKFRKRFLSSEEAVREAMNFPSGPVIIADAADNPGGGGTGDSTFILRSLIKAEAKNVGLAFITDTESVEQAINAGVNSKVKLNLGGKLAPKEITGGPIEITANVKTITDGQFILKGPMSKGLVVNMGRTVVLDVGSIEIIVAERHMQAFDAEIFRRVGIEPADKKILVLKSAVHFKASFGPIAKRIIDVNSSAYQNMDFESLNFKNISRPIFPLDKIETN